MPRGRARQGKAEAFMVKSGTLLGRALGGVKREIAETRKRLSALMAQAAKLRGRLVSLKGRRTSAASPPASGSRGSHRSRRPRQPTSDAPKKTKRRTEVAGKRGAGRKRRPG